jgi:hypothetical protein
MGVELHLKIFNNLTCVVNLTKVVTKGYSKLKFTHPDPKWKKSRGKLYIKYSEKLQTFVVWTHFVILNETDIMLSVFSYNDLNDAKYLVTDQDKRVFIMGKTRHEHYGLEYHDRELKKVGIVSGKVKIGNSCFPRKLPHTLVSKLACTQSEKDYLMHTVIIRPNVVELNAEMGISTKIIHILPREVICNQTKRTLEVRQNGTKLDGAPLIVKRGKRGIMHWVHKEKTSEIVINFLSESETLCQSSPIDISKTSYKEFWVHSVGGEFPVLRYFRQVVSKMNDS